MIFEGTKNQFFFGLGLTRAGETIPDIEKCGRLAEFYGVTMDSLIKDDVQLEGQKMAPAPKGKHMWGVVTVNDRGDSYS